MRGLSTSIRPENPCVRQVLRTIEEAHPLTPRMLAVGPFARVLALHLVAAVLADGDDAWDGALTGATAHRWPLWLRRWGGRRLSGLAGSARAGAGRSRSVCRWPRRRGGGAGTVAAWCARARGGVGGTRRAPRPGPLSRRSGTPPPGGTARRPRR